MNRLSFTNPWLLAGLVAVGLPIVIHFLTRARPGRIAFPPFRFLVEACAGQQAVHRLRTLVLLTVRCLAVLAMVLLFARPFLRPQEAAAAPDCHRRAVLVLDASLSMRAIYEGVSLFARAQAEAADVLRGLDPGSEAAVVLLGATPQALLPALSRNLPALHDALVQAQPTFENGDVAATLAAARKLLGEGTGTLFVFSDFQQSNWGAVESLPGGVNCQLRRVAPVPVENVALTSARVAPAEPVAGEAAEVVCTVFNFSPRAREEVVRLELGEATLEKRVTLQPFRPAEVVFTVTLARPGPVSGRASLGPDDLREDDVRHLAVRVQERLQILLISDAEGNDRRSAAYFVEHALAPSAQAAPGLKIVRRHSQDADRGMLETAEVFVIVAPAALTGEAVEVIGRRVQEGSQLVVFLDGPTSGALASPVFGAPFVLGLTRRSETGDAIQPGPRRFFAESEAGDWSGLRFRRHFETQPLPGRSGDEVFLYPDGSAALTYQSLGKGAVAFANLPLTLDAGDFVGHPMFPTLLHELLRLLRRGAEEPAVTPGAAWTLSASAAGEGDLWVQGPEGTRIDAPVVARGRITRLAMPAARMPGVYQVEQPGGVVGVGVVNVDPRESDPRPVALETLKPGVGSTVAVVRNEGDLLVAARARPLWPFLAGMSAVLLALEMALLAWWRRRPLAVGGAT